MWAYGFECPAGSGAKEPRPFNESLFWLAYGTITSGDLQSDFSLSYLSCGFLKFPQTRADRADLIEVLQCWGRSRVSWSHPVSQSALETLFWPHQCPLYPNLLNESINFWLGWVFVAACGLALFAARGFLIAVAFGCGTQALGARASAVTAYRLSALWHVESSWTKDGTPCPLNCQRILNHWPPGSLIYPIS